MERSVPGSLKTQSHCMQSVVAAAAAALPTISPFPVKSRVSDKRRRRRRFVSGFTCGEVTRSCSARDKIWKGDGTGLFIAVLDQFHRRSIRCFPPYRWGRGRKAESVSSAVLQDRPHIVFKLYGNPGAQNIASLTSLVSRRQREKTQEMKLRRKSMQKRERNKDSTPQRKAEIRRGVATQVAKLGRISCRGDCFETFLTNWCSHILTLSSHLVCTRKILCV